MRSLVLGVCTLAACNVTESRFFNNGEPAVDASVDSVATVDSPPVDAPPPGSYLWARSLSAVSPLGVAEGAGGVVVAGYFSAPIDLGGGTRVPAGSTDMIIAGFDADDAAHVYSTPHGAAGGTAYAWVQALDSVGAPMAYGVSYGPIDLGLGSVPAGGSGPPYPTADGWIGRYGASIPGWVQRIVGPNEDKVLASAYLPGGSVYGAGFFEGTSTTLGGNTLPAFGYRDVFLARFNGATGQVLLSKTWGDTGRDEVSGMAATANNVFLSGFFDGTLTFAPLAGLVAATSLDCFVVKLDNNFDGVWAVRFGSTGIDRDPRMSIDAEGDVYVAGSFSGTVDVGLPAPLTSLGGTDIFVVKLRGTDGTVVWAVTDGTTGDDSVSDLAVGAAGSLAISGSLEGVNGAGAGDFDGFVASFDAETGASRWRHVFAGPGRDTTSSVAYGFGGDVYAPVSMSAQLDFGVPIIGSQNPSSVLLKIAP